MDSNLNNTSKNGYIILKIVKLFDIIEENFNAVKIKALFYNENEKYDYEVNSKIYYNNNNREINLYYDKSNKKIYSLIIEFNKLNININDNKISKSLNIGFIHIKSPFEICNKFDIVVYNSPFNIKFNNLNNLINKWKPKNKINISIDYISDEKINFLPLKIYYKFNKNNEVFSDFLVNKVLFELPQIFRAKLNHLTGYEFKINKYFLEVYFDENYKETINFVQKKDTQFKYETNNTINIKKIVGDLNFKIYCVIMIKDNTINIPIYKEKLNPENLGNIESINLITKTKSTISFVNEENIGDINSYYYELSNKLSNKFFEDFKNDSFLTKSDEKNKPNEEFNQNIEKIKKNIEAYKNALNKDNTSNNEYKRENINKLWPNLNLNKNKKNKIKEKLTKYQFDLIHKYNKNDFYLNFKFNSIKFIFENMQEIYNLEKIYLSFYFYDKKYNSSNLGFSNIDILKVNLSTLNSQTLVLCPIKYLQNGEGNSEEIISIEYNFDNFYDNFEFLNYLYNNSLVFNIINPKTNMVLMTGHYCLYNLLQTNSHEENKNIDEEIDLFDQLYLNKIGTLSIQIYKKKGKIHNYKKNDLLDDIIYIKKEEKEDQESRLHRVLISTTINLDQDQLKMKENDLKRKELRVLRFNKKNNINKDLHLEATFQEIKKYKEETKKQNLSNKINFSDLEIFKKSTFLGAPQYYILKLNNLSQKELIYYFNIKSLTKHKIEKNNSLSIVTNEKEIITINRLFNIHKNLPKFKDNILFLDQKNEILVYLKFIDYDFNMINKYYDYKISINDNEGSIIKEFQANIYIKDILINKEMLLFKNFNDKIEIKIKKYFDYKLINNLVQKNQIYCINNGVIVSDNDSLTLIINTKQDKDNNIIVYIYENIYFCKLLFTMKLKIEIFDEVIINYNLGLEEHKIINFKLQEPIIGKIIFSDYSDIILDKILIKNINLTSGKNKIKLRIKSFNQKQKIIYMFIIDKNYNIFFKTSIKLLPKEPNIIKTQIIQFDDEEEIKILKINYENAHLKNKKFIINTTNNKLIKWNKSSFYLNPWSKEVIEIKIIKIGLYGVEYILISDEESLNIDAIKLDILNN